MTELTEAETKRRDRMIAAFNLLNADKRRLPDRQYGVCRQCGADVEWITTAKGKRMAQIPNMGEPHIVHCEKYKWGINRWSQEMKAIIELEKQVNSETLLTVPIAGGYKLLRGKAARAALKKPFDKGEGVPW